MISILISSGRPSVPKYLSLVFAILAIDIPAYFSVAFIVRSIDIDRYGIYAKRKEFIQERIRSYRVGFGVFEGFDFGLGCYILYPDAFGGI